MKPEKGFSLIELLVAMAILLVVTAVATQAIMQAQNVSQAVALEANMQEDLRASMHFIVRDLTQAGEGIPEAGISIPNTAAGVSAINRPGLAVAGIFESQAAVPVTYTALPPVIPGSQLGTVVTTQNPVTKAILTGGFNTDIITVLYADNILVSSGGAEVNQPLNAFPVTQAAPAAPVCAGVITANGSSVTLDPACFTMPGAQTAPLAVGNLILFHNINGTALEYVTAVAGQVLTFGAGDPAGLNQTGLPQGTVSNLNVAATPTTITRVWMVTYYLDTVTIPARPQLVRQVNYPNYPAGAPANPPQPIGEVIENLSFSYDIINSLTPASYPKGPGDATTAIAPDTPFQIRAINAYIGGRSEYPWTGTTTPQFLRNSLSTQVSVRSLSFGLLFPTPGILP